MAIDIGRRQFISALGGAAVAWPVAARAQQRTDVPRVGFLGVDTASILEDRIGAFRGGLRDLGYVEGKNIVVEFRYADGRYDRLSSLVSQLIDLKVSLLVTQGSPATVAAKQSTKTIPIVMTAVGDAVSQGIVDGLARPGANLTGVSFQSPELSTKRLELLTEVRPGISQVAVLTNPNNSSTGIVLKAMEIAARSVKIGLYEASARGSDELVEAFLTIANRRVDAVIVMDDPMTIANGKTIADLIATYRLPSASFTEIAEAGGLLAYGPNRLEMYRRAAYFVDKILKGQRPSDIPVELPTKFDLIVNLKTARALDLKIPSALLATADKVIE